MKRIYLQQPRSSIALDSFQKAWLSAACEFVLLDLPHRSYETLKIDSPV